VKATMAQISPWNTDVDVKGDRGLLVSVTRPPMINPKYKQVHLRNPSFALKR